MVSEAVAATAGTTVSERAAAVTPTAAMLCLSFIEGLRM
jgi:hypothetical protein